MNEPFLPLPLPSPPEMGYGRILSRVARRLAARLRGRRSRSAGNPCRRVPEPRLAAGAGREGSRCLVRFPVLPPAEF